MPVFKKMPADRIAKMNRMKTNNTNRFSELFCQSCLIVMAVLFPGLPAGAQVTNTSMTVADAFLCTGSINYQNGADLTGVNFGAAGTLAIAPASAVKGEFQSVIRFSLADGVAQFNAAYGTNNWTITAVSLELTSNYGVAGVQPNNPIFNVIAGGQFVIEWLANDDWVEGTGTPNLPTTDGVCYNSLPDLLASAHEPLCTNTYVPPGNNAQVIWPLPLTGNLAANVSAGGDVNLRFYAADDLVSYLFNSYKYGRGNEPLIHVVATPRLKILAGAFADGVFQLTGIGLNNQVYTVQVCTNLAAANWQAIGTTTAAAAGAIVFDDATGALPSQRFYRLSQ
jgi:hypothetical protein